MAKDLKIVNGGLVFTEDGDLEYVEGAEELAQNIRIQLSTQRGTHVEDEDLGFPFRELLFKKNPDPALIAGVVKDLLLARPDVISVGPVLSEIDPLTRKHTLSFEAVTTEGLLSGNLEI